jgi:branched-subunit amino acid transport protein
VNALTLAVVIATLGGGTYLLRLGGILLARRVRPLAPDSHPAPGRRARLGAWITRLLPYAAVALLAALAATAAVTEAGRVAGIARPAGVLAGLAAGLLRAPFVVAVVLAAAVAAGLRLLGVE